MNTWSKNSRSRDPKFASQKAKYASKPRYKRKYPAIMSANEFQFDPISKTCICPANETMWLMTEGIDKNGNHKLHFAELRVPTARIESANAVVVI